MEIIRFNSTSPHHNELMHGKENCGRLKMSGWIAAKWRRFWSFLSRTRFGFLIELVSFLLCRIIIQTWC